MLDYARSLDNYNQYGKADIDKNIAWLEKQSKIQNNMNENIDLTKILDGCPVGTKFYSTLQGEVSFINIDTLAEHPIIVSVYNKRADVIVHDSYAKDGRYNSFYDGECTIFPSKDQRDWSKFVRFWDKPKTEKFDPKTLQPFDKLLVRPHPCAHWRPDFYAFKINATVRTIGGCDSRMCIPYNDDTKYLVGTIQDCPKYYKWWEE